MFTVTVFAAGDHSHGGEGRSLPNSFGADSAELIEHLLKRAGYTKDLNWECRIDKMLHCSHDSRPIRIVGFKPYGVSLRVKPKENSTVDQLCTLLIPTGSGYSAKNLFEQLKANEKSISRHWRKEQQQKDSRMEEVKVTAPPQMHIPLVDVVPLPAPVEEESRPAITPVVVAEEQHEEQEEQVPSFPNLKELHKDKVKLVFVLRHIQMLSQDKSIKNKDEFITLLRGQCRWEKILLRYCSRAVNELVKNDFVMECIGSNHKVVGFTLTEKGYETIGMKSPTPTVPNTTVKPKPVVVAPPIAPAPLDFVKLLVEGRSKMQELADAAARLESNKVRETALREEIRKMEAEIAQVQEENRQIARVVENSQEAHEALKRLVALITPLPLEGARPQGTPVQ